LIGWEIEVKHITEILLDAMKKGKLSRAVVEKVTYHDPCHLGRHLGHFKEPRGVLDGMGCELVEMKESNETSFCCGGGGGFRSNCPEIAKRMAEERIRQAKETGTKKLVTTCPLCYLHLKENAKGIDVVELSQLF